METMRARFGSAFEWIVASVFLVATVGVAGLIVWEMFGARPAPVSPSQPAPVASEAERPAGISVPALLLSDGRQVRLGDTLDEVKTKIGEGTSGAEPARGRLGPRITRSYEVGGSRFLMVFEPFERNGAPRVTAIYLH